MCFVPLSAPSLVAKRAQQERGPKAVAAAVVPQNEAVVHRTRHGYIFSERWVVTSRPALKQAQDMTAHDDKKGGKPRGRGIFVPVLLGYYR